MTERLYIKIWQWTKKLISIHGWGQSLRLNSVSNIVSDSHHFVSCQSFLRYSFFKIWPWKSEVKCHGWSESSKSQSGSNFLSVGHLIYVIWLFQNLTLKIQGQGQSSRFHGGSNILSTRISFVPSQSAMSVDFENSRSWVKVEITQLAQHPFNVFPFCHISISPTIPIVCLTTKN